MTIELPLLVVDVQRGGPSTGLPTKTEQADLLQSMFGRNGEAPLPIIAPRSPADCFAAALDAARIAVTYRTPVILLSDGSLANGSEPWRVPDARTCPTDRPGFATEPNAPDGYGEFWPYLRDPDTLARPWAVPGTPGLEHRIGGLEKADGTGDISYEPANHDSWCRTRAAQDRRHRGASRPSRSTTPTGDARCSCSAGAPRTGRSGPAPAGARARARGRPGPPAASQPVAGEPRRRAGALRHGDRPRDEPRPAVAAAAGRYLVDVDELQPGRGLPFSQRSCRTDLGRPRRSDHA